MFKRWLHTLTARHPKITAPFKWMQRRRKKLIALFILFAHALGALTSVHAILGVRTSQGAIAWAVSLNTFPYVAVPAYWVFGRSDFEGYILVRRSSAHELTARQQEVARAMEAMRPSPESEPESAKLLQKLAMMPATRG